MTSTTFFFFFIPLLAIILLVINLIFAPHNPYQEKDSAFECGFHSFLGQNRTQFSISFFIFALLFLLFDLEILLVYPYIVSAYTNDIYGLVVMLIFFLVLTLGFAFELGKNALKIDSRQLFSVVSKQLCVNSCYSSLFYLTRNNSTLKTQCFKFLSYQYAEFYYKNIYIYLCIIILCFVVICINSYVYINHYIDQITYLLDICKGNISLGVLFYAYITSCITKYLYSLLVNSKHYYVFTYIVKQEKIKKYFIFFVYIYYTWLDYIKYHLNSLIYLYLVVLIIVYNAPWLISLIYMLTALYVLSLNMILFIYINYIIVNFKDNYVITYYILCILSIGLSVLAFFSLANHYIIFYNTIKTYMRGAKYSSNQSANLRPLRPKPSNTEEQGPNNNKSPQNNNNNKSHLYYNEKKKDEQDGQSEQQRLYPEQVEFMQHGQQEPYSTNIFEQQEEQITLEGTLRQIPIQKLEIKNDRVNKRQRDKYPAKRARLKEKKEREKNRSDAELAKKRLNINYILNDN